MNEPLAFAKLSGSGNDFILIDNSNDRLAAVLASPEMVSALARRLCRRGLGIGADGMIVAHSCECEVADIKARFFEADGSEVELCGNGVACFVHWAVAEKIVPVEDVRILTPAGIVRGRHGVDGYVQVCIPMPVDAQTDMVIDLEGEPWTYDFMCVGVPHLITYVDDIDAVEVAHLGAAFRHHQRFQPRGVNANFVQVIAEGEIAVRTYEFGVEAETLACGTGSTAAVIMSAQRFGWDQKYMRGEEPALVRSRGGDVLRVYFTLRDDGTVSDPCIETVVRFIYSGIVRPEMIAGIVNKGNDG